MSFQNFGRIDSRDARSRRGGGSNNNSNSWEYARASSYQAQGSQYDRECSHIQNMLTEYTQLIEKIKRSSQALSQGTIKKSELNRLHGTSQEANATANDITRALSSFSSFYRGGACTEAEQRERWKKHQRLLRDFQSLQNEFDAELKIALRAERSYSQHTASNSISFSHAQSEPDSLEEREQLIQQQELDNEIAFTEALIEERDKGIEEIQKQMSEVAQTFQDLHQIVMDSGEYVDDIASHMDTTLGQAKGGLEHVRKADEYQVTRRKTILCMLLCLLVFIAALLLYFLLLDSNTKKT